MIDELIVEGPSVEEAVDAALEQMGVQQDAVCYEVIQEPGGYVPKESARRVRVKVWLKDDYRARERLESTSGDADGPEGASSLTYGGPLADDELDAIADAGIAAIEAILMSLGLDGEIEEYEGEDGEIILDIVGDDLAVLIGRHGRTLDALQAIVQTIVTRNLGLRYPLIVDVSGYRHRHRIKLEEIARSAANKAVRLHRPVQLRPMSGFERRIVHITLRDDRRVETQSEGEEPRRMVVVRPR